MKYPNNLKYYRLKAGLTQKQVAEKLGLHSSQDRISMWENGIAVPNILNLLMLCELYKMNPQKIYPELCNTKSESDRKIKPKMKDKLISQLIL